jgi:DNA-directed RNA polymerase subunit RPC12/RpoP
MNRILLGLVVFAGVLLLLLGAIFVIASGTENTIAGAVLVLIAIVLFVFAYRSEKVEAAKPTVVQQTFNVKMEGSGQLKEHELKCKSCGASLSDKDIMVVQGGVVVKCPYCGTIQALEEAPKW